MANNHNVTHKVNFVSCRLDYCSVMPC